MNKKYTLGLDIGTTSAKSVLFTTNGSVVSEHEVTYPTIHPEPAWVEQDPYIIENAAITAIKSTMEKSQIHPDELISIGLSSAMHSLICMDEKGDALTNTITWADGRSVKQASQLKGSEIGSSIYLKTGTPIHPMSPLLKLIWMKETGYPPYEKAWKFVSIKEFLIYRWFQKAVVDFSVASATGMFNIHSLEWEKEALALAGINEEQLSAPVPPTYLLEGLSVEIAGRMGVKQDLPFAIGGSDGPLANLGIGATESGDTAITIGTSGAIRQMSSSPKTDMKQEVFCYAVSNDLWILGGATNNGGNVLQWLKTVLGEKENCRSGKFK
ncbi:MAG: gluconokinase [Bacillus sp. (in: Bacteria)]|nr:gluconokinase [Bacillus sp. (in: firmicutes)]